MRSDEDEWGGLQPTVSTMKNVLLYKVWSLLGFAEKNPFLSIFLFSLGIIALIIHGAFSFASLPWQAFALYVGLSIFALLVLVVLSFLFMRKHVRM